MHVGSDWVTLNVPVSTMWDDGGWTQAGCEFRLVDPIVWENQASLIARRRPVAFVETSNLHNHGFVADIWTAKSEFMACFPCVVTRCLLISPLLLATVFDVELLLLTNRDK